MLRAEAQLARKKLLFVGADDLCRIVRGAMQRHGLALKDL